MNNEGAEGHADGSRRRAEWDFSTRSTPRRAFDAARARSTVGVVARPRRDARERAGSVTRVGIRADAAIEARWINLIHPSSSRRRDVARA